MGDRLWPRVRVAACFVLTLGLLVPFAPACGSEDEPILVTDQIGIALNLKDDDVVAGVVEDRKNISTEQSNPYGRFLDAIVSRFGADPVEIRVDGVSIALQEAKDDVANLEDLFAGEVEVFLAPDDQAAGYVVGTLGSVSGRGPHAMDLGPDADQLRPFAETLRGGSFRVGVRGATVTDPGRKFDVKLSVTLTFGAYEW